MIGHNSGVKTQYNNKNVPKLAVVVQVCVKGFGLDQLGFHVLYVGRD